MVSRVANSWAIAAGEREKVLRMPVPILDLLGTGGDHGQPGQDGVSPGFAGGDHLVAEVLGDLDFLEGVSPVGVESGQDAESHVVTSSW